MTPFRISILTDLDEKTSPIVIADYFFDAIFVIDTTLYFYFPFVDDATGNIVTDPKTIRTRYRKSWGFLINITACLPILMFVPTMASWETRIPRDSINLLRMIRVLHMLPAFQELKIYMNRSTQVNESMFRMNIILFFALLGLSILGCVYFFMSVRFYKEQQDDAPRSYFCDSLQATNYTKRLEFLDQDSTWVGDDALIYDAVASSPGCHYGIFFIRSIYYMMQTLFTIGYGDTVVPNGSSMNEMFLACCFMLVGVFGYGLIIANMTSVLANIDVVSMRYRHEMDLLSKWMVIRSMPESLRERINVYFHYVFRKQRGMLDKDLFHDLPFTLKSQFSQVHKELITKVPFFNSEIRSEHFIFTVCNSLEDRIYAPGSYLMYQFEKQRELVIVVTGRCDIHIEGTKGAVSSLTPGDFIGDYNLLFGTVNQVGVRAPDFCEVLVLTLNSLEEFCDDPNFAFLNFRELGCNFRNSEDKGVLDTLSKYDDFIKKLTAMVSTVNKGSKNNKLKDMMEKVQVVVHGIMIYPHDKFHVYWDILLLVIKGLYCIMIPVRICWNLTAGGFDPEVMGTDGLKDSFDLSLILEYIFDIVYWLDMAGQMHAFAYVDYNMGSEVVVDRQLIASRYKESKRFRFDILTSIPFDILGGAVGYWSMWRLPKMTRIVHLINNVSQLQKHLEEAMQVTLTETHVSVINMTVFTLVLILWSSVGWNIARNLEDNRENFIKSIYWSFTTFTTVGYGDITPDSENQTIYALLIGAFGAVVCAAIIANVTSFVHDVDISEDNVEHKVNCLKWFLEGHNVSFEYIEKVQDYFNHVERDQDGLNEDTMLSGSVPSHLRQDILVHITAPMVLKSSFFKGCTSGFLRRIMLNLEQTFFSTLFMIMTTNSPATGMYFIKSGIVEMMTDKKGNLILNNRLTADDSFAEGSLLEHWEKNPFVARAGTDCELWFLSRATFNEIVNDFPEIRNHLSQFTNKATESMKRSCTMLKRQTVLLSSEKVLETKWFVHPDNMFISVWMGVVLLFILNNLIMVPFRTAFLENFGITAVIAFDYIGDIVYLLDSVIRINFLGYYDDGHLIIDPKAIREHFKKNGFYYGHIISALPLDFIAFFIKPVCPFGTLQIWSLLRLNKCLRVREMSYLTHDLEKAASKAGIKFNKNALRVSKLLIVILISAHWLGGIFFILGNLDQYLGGDEGPIARNWLQAHENLVDKVVSCDGNVTPTSERMMDQYIAALYWAMATLTTVGYGDVTAVSNNEVFFATLVLILGTGIYTIVIANLEDIVSQLDVTSSLYKMKRDSVTNYMDMQGLPLELRQKVNSYYNVCWTTQKGINGKKLLHYMPRAMRSDLLFEMLNDLMSQMFFIKDCSSDFVSIVLEHLTFDIFTQGDVLFHSDEQADSVFIIHSGDVDLLTKDGVKFKTVSSSILGDGNFFLREPHICMARAASNCEIFQLNFENFWTCLHHGQLTSMYVDYLEENQKVLHKFSAMVNKMKNNLNSSKMAKMMDTGQDDGVPKHIILPNSKLRRSWDSLACMFTTVLLIIIPYRICFAAKSFEGTTLWLVIDILLDLFFAADIYLRMKHFAEMKDGFVVTKETEFKIMYMHGSFQLDTISLLPLSYICLAFVDNMQTIAMLRLLQCLRVARFTYYLDAIVISLAEYGKIAISTAILRIIQMFILVLFLCHWFGCVYYFIAKTTGFEDDKGSWVYEDDKVDATHGLSYIRSFYWALYTLSTVGYGSVPCNTIPERLFAMVVMAIGAVICDAGITAVLTSLISNKDHQAGTNHRRIECCKRYMKSAFIDQVFQTRILNFYSYADTDLKNLDESEILGDVSVAVASSILHHFCFSPLRKASFLTGKSDGFISSLAKDLVPYIAVPGEKLSEISKECVKIFVMQRGKATLLDSTKSHEENVTSGSVIGHMVTDANFKENGKLMKGVEVNFVDVRNLAKGSGDPYVLLTCGYKSCMSTIKKAKYWDENYTMKLVKSDENGQNGATAKECEVKLMGWQKNSGHYKFGSFKFELEDDGDGDNIMSFKNYTLLDDQGNKAGQLKMGVRYFDLDENDVADSHEVTVTCVNYCHLYALEAHKVATLEKFYAASRFETLRARLPKVETSDEYTEYCKNEEQLGWRRPSKPILDINFDFNKNRSALSMSVVGEGGDGEEEDSERASSGRPSALKILLKVDSLENKRVKLPSLDVSDFKKGGVSPMLKTDLKISTSPKLEKTPSRPSMRRQSSTVLGVDTGLSRQESIEVMKRLSMRQEGEPKSPNSPGLDDSSHGVIKRVHVRMDTQEFTQRIKRRNSISVDPAELARAVNVQKGSGGKGKTEMIRELKKSTWSGSGRVRAPTISVSAKANDAASKAMLAAVPTKEDLAKMMNGARSPKIDEETEEGSKRQLETKGKFKKQMSKKLNRRKASLLERAENIVIAKDWDNVATVDGMVYDKTKHHKFFIDWSN